MSEPIMTLEQAITIFLAYDHQGSITDEERRIYNIAWGRIYQSGEQFMRMLKDQKPC